MIDLLKKYGKPVPRYTSYPTAPEWSSEFDMIDYETAVCDASASDDNLSIYIHIPFCSRRCAFCGCTTLVPSSGEIVSDYLASIEREMNRVCSLLGGRRSLAQVHWGGGTPTFLKPNEMIRLFNMIESRFSITRDAEIAIEVDPRVTTKEHVTTLADLGFNRISLGVQDFSEEVQEAIGRRQNFKQTAELYSLLRRTGFKGINMDFVYGLPRQTMERFQNTVSELIKLRPDRIAIYNFAYLPSMKPHQRAINEKDLPDVEQRQELFAYAVQALTEGKYEQVGMDHFALPDDELVSALKSRKLHRNFMGYTTKPASDMIGFGMSAISDIAGRYAQNESRIGSYLESIAEHSLATYRGYSLKRDDLIRRRLITFLMCNMIIPFNLLHDEFGIEFAEYFKDEYSALEEFESDGLVQRHEDRLEVTNIGRTFIRNIASVFDVFSAGKQSGRTQYSQSV